jgi:NADH-quinone oxidoreductase subunit H
MRWSFFFMAEYAAMFVVSGVATVLFLGGWHTGLAPIDDGLLAGLREPGAGAVAAWLANLVGMVVFVTKASLLVFVQIWVRWTLPRLRIDQVMTTCLKYLVPISCFLFLGAILWPLVLAFALGRTSLVPWPEHISRPLGERVPKTVSTPAAPRAAAGRAVAGAERAHGSGAAHGTGSAHETGPSEARP